MLMNVAKYGMEHCGFPVRLSDMFFLPRIYWRENTYIISSKCHLKYSNRNDQLCRRLFCVPSPKACPGAEPFCWFPWPLVVCLKMGIPWDPQKIPTFGMEHVVFPREKKGVHGVHGQMMRKNLLWTISHDLQMGESKFTALYEVPALSRSKFRYFVQLMWIYVNIPRDILWLVAWNMFNFPQYMGLSFPLTFIFFKMVETTNQYSIYERFLKLLHVVNHPPTYAWARPGGSQRRLWLQLCPGRNGAPKLWVIGSTVLKCT